MPIESIVPGDRVLSQDYETGELEFRPVESCSVRPPTALLDLAMGADSIQTTAGHPLWVVGSGSRTAKHLKVGDRLHTVNGAVTIDHIEERKPETVYNLVVSENHSFYVGNGLLLVHDNSPLLENASLVPGLVPASFDAKSSSSATER